MLEDAGGCNLGNLQLPAIALQGVSKLYGSFVALHEVSLTLAAGTSAVLLGSNGSGKSTLLKLLAGLARPSYGNVSIFGSDPFESRGRIAHMSHSTMLYDELTAPENLTYLLALQRPELHVSERKSVAAHALEQVGLDPGNRRRIGEYSQGMRQRTSLARVLMTEPDLLLLDEPFSNLDVDAAHAMVSLTQNYLRQTAPSGFPRTLLLTTHQAALAKPLAQMTLMLQDGDLRASGSEMPTTAFAGAP